ncbi:hypothetical protein NT2_05_02940 [Caenibius tardaugens NBRC 16725]|uniref:DUF1330 domain-containing protein n=1 Tax=Caenibius tardaugens NBRC 16725 TaxID=1219035 RepID=U2ZVJ2_9SPHN|nr:hypothetical protein [Caenibius tardaugens]AZI36713.1 hypothetical protein EGO55_12720 [Caenibius tardaugens NBRC 16725]GAD49374.1 hypothetical protein NT2_05_02940 [Caenibius tardaugens NBRC 16725]
MLILAQFDLASADMALFELYENQVLGLLAKYGGKVRERVRSTDNGRELHLLEFPDAGALDAFRADPDRAALQPLWLKTGATSSLTEVHRLSHP